MEHAHASEHILALIAIILILSKIFSALSSKFKQPSVLGMLLIGLVLGPSVLDVIATGPITQAFSRIGVIILLFIAGLETDIQSMKKTGRTAFAVALGGVLLPFASGFSVGYLFGYSIFTSLIFGTMCTATSVSVSVMTLIDLKKLRSVEGTTILSAAIIDDVIGILLLTFVFGIFDSAGGNIWISFGKILGYMTAALLFGVFLVRPVMNLAKNMAAEKAILSIAIALAFIYAWGAELVEVAPITGAYFAGVFIGQTRVKRTVMEEIETLGHALFIPIFFVNIGLETNLREGNFDFLFLILFVGAAIITKIIGSGGGARFSGFSFIRSFAIGIGMVPRGEVILIIANIALAKNLIGQSEFSTTIILVILSTLITPFLLKWSFNKEKEI